MKPSHRVLKFVQVVARKLAGYAREHLIGFLFTTAFGMCGTFAIFYFTSSPTSSAEIRKELISITRADVQKKTNQTVNDLTLDSVVSESLDLSASNSIFVFGTAVTSDGGKSRCLAIFEPSSPRLIDKWIGRPGFYELKYSALIPLAFSSDIVPTDIKVEDIDLDGNKEIFVYIKSTRADNTEKGLIIIRKGGGEEWHLISIPSLTKRLHLFTSGQPQNPSGLSPAAPPYIWFGSSGKFNRKKLLEQYNKFNISEETMEVTDTWGRREFSMLQVGSEIKLFDHPYAGYRHLGVASYVTDENAVQDPHHIMVTFFKVEDERLVLDQLWNWGYPMLSTDTEHMADLNLDEFHQAGLSRHLIGKTFVGYTSFAPISSP